MGNKLGKKKQDFSQAEKRRSFYLALSDIPSDIEEFEKGLLAEGFVVNQLFGAAQSNKIRRHLRLTADRSRLFLAKESKKQEKNVDHHRMSADVQDFVRGLRPSSTQINLNTSSTTVRERWGAKDDAPGIIFTHQMSNESIMIQTTQQNHQNLLRLLRQVARVKSTTGRRVSSGGIVLLEPRASISESSRRRSSM